MRFNAKTLLVPALAVAVLATGMGRAQDGAKPPVVVLDTTLGEVRIELNPAKAPISSKNFVDYVKEKHYDGLVFHRVIPGFMVQGGGMDAKLQERKTRAPIQNEAKNGLSNLRGTISMARTQNPHSATSQFFINVVDNKNLDPGGFDPNGYAVFGKVIKGMEVVDKIVAVKTETKEPYENVPVEAVVIRSAKLLEEAPKAEPK
jgi:peptidyl-prolyl cis-trans isomerase A (cyclophilin A)